ncbi:uncharacterized protein LOC132301329 [Cornus florida]|uniref:uncharacterized protein LOC132301329 n=1 Tax=Cornus florida TaxID=4283 RepID=UPI0028A0F8C5|nr:uncharacterized protein LOC132301329 [Cornus florida]
MSIHLFLTSLITLTALQNTHALQFKVTNNAGSSPGGLRFTKEIEAERARQIMITATNFIWNMLHQTNPSDRKRVEAGNGNGQTPVGLIEGMADYTILKAHYEPKGYAKPGQGEKWDQGYDFTARFLEYCEGVR